MTVPLKFDRFHQIFCQLYTRILIRKNLWLLHKNLYYHVIKKKQRIFEIIFWAYFIPFSSVSAADFNILLQLLADVQKSEIAANKERV